MAHGKFNGGDNKLSKYVFKDFLEYHKMTKSLSEVQRKKIFDSLSDKERKMLSNSYVKGGWEDLLIRNSIDKKIDTIREKYDINLIGLRSFLMSGNTLDVPLDFWNEVKESFANYSVEHTKYAIGGIKETYTKDNTYRVYYELN